MTRNHKVLRTNQEKLPSTANFLVVISCIWHQKERSKSKTRQIDDIKPDRYTSGNKVELMLIAALYTITMKQKPLNDHLQMSG